MTIDLTTLTDEELDALGDDAIRVEKHRRDNLKKMPESKAAVEAALPKFPKAALAVNVEQDDVDGDYVVIDTGGNDALMSELLTNGGIFKSATQVRVHAARAAKEGGDFEKLEALL